MNLIDLIYQQIKFSQKKNMMHAKKCNIYYFKSFFIIVTKKILIVFICQLAN